MGEEEARGLWDKALTLLDSNASPASVEVVKMSPECNKMPEDEQEIEAA